MKKEKNNKKRKSDAVLYGLLAGLGLILFYILFITFFQGINFAFISLRNLWYWILPLSVGFGTQIGLYAQIKHTAALNAEIATTGTISGGSMIACCAHYILNLIPIIGLTSLGILLLQYQKFFFGVGIIGNIVGIILMLRHKKKMNMKGGKC